METPAASSKPPCVGWNADAVIRAGPVRPVHANPVEGALIERPLELSDEA